MRAKYPMKKGEKIHLQEKRDEEWCPRSNYWEVVEVYPHHCVIVNQNKIRRSITNVDLMLLGILRG